MKPFAAYAIAMLLAGCASSGSAPATEPPAPPNGPALGDMHYACGDPPGFLPSLLDQPAVAELEPHPVAEALRRAIAESGPDIDLLPVSGYWLVSRDEASAEFLARDPREASLFAAASFENQGGAWKISGWGQCRPTIVLDGLSLATWTLDPDVPRLVAEATRFTALVTERSCTGGEAMGGRLLPPSITYAADRILVVFAARPLAGDAFDCQGNPSARVVVELREPLAARRLLDAGVFPPADPALPAS